MNRGRFITLEGGEGVGKTSALDAIAARLEAHGVRVLVTREPGGTALGESLRAILLQNGIIHPHAELLMMFAARVQHVRQVILPALEAGTWVVSDRFVDASYAYQGGGRGIAENTIEDLEAWCLDGLTPDLTLLIDAPIEVGMARVQQRGNLDRFEAEALDFQQRVRDAYRRRAARFPGRIATVDGSATAEDVRRRLTEILDERFAGGW